MDYAISKQDKAILREEARKQMDFANRESNIAKRKEWYLHNDLKGTRPMIHLETWTFAQELLPQRLHCTGDFAREMETKLICNYLNQDLFDDDRVTPDYFPLEYDCHFKLFNIDEKVDHTQEKNGGEGIGYHFQPQLEDLEDDFHKIQKSDFGVDMDATHAKLDILNDTFGDILPVKMSMDCLYSVPTQMLIHLMGMENLIFAMTDYPELFLDMMNRIADDTLDYYKLLESKKLILPTTGAQALGQGSWCYTHELPGEEEFAKRAFTPKDVWGFMDSQETVVISPKMYEEMIFPCYKKISEQFGLLSYGCCEPVDPIWDNCISKLDNLRRVSISPWSNEDIMGERLRDRKTVIYHRKPSPNMLGTGTVLDENAVRASIDKTLECAKGCKLEITQRDVYTINHDIPKAQRYVNLIKEEIAKHW
ncbi:MAG: hypothetical protein PHS82_00075 [Lachnospiraceae bacterium]|nr:hypothetical protein [Lachnospiraceae bacterium]